MLWYKVVQFNKMYQQRISNNFNNNFNKLMKAYAVSPTTLDTMCFEMYVASIGKRRTRRKRDESGSRKKARQGQNKLKFVYDKLCSSANCSQILLVKNPKH